MLRAFRCALSELDAFSIKYAKNSEKILPYLKAKAGEESASLLAVPVIDGRYVNYYTALQGGIKPFDPGTFAHNALNSASPLNIDVNQALKLLQERRERLLFCLQNAEGSAPKELLESKDELLGLIAGARHGLFIDDKPLLLPLRLVSDAKLPPCKTLPPKTSNAAAGSRRSWHRLLPLLLLLLIGLLLLWWFFLKPWPFEKKPVESPPINTESLTTNSLKESVKPQDPEPKVKDDAKPADKTMVNLPVETPKVKSEPKPTPPKKESNESDNNVRLNKSVASKDHSKGKILNQASLLPQCTILKREGKMPQLAIAFDGSGSMMREDVSTSKGNTSRLAAAIEAAHNLIPSIDKNVNIGFIEINGCPISKNHGFFDYARRPKLLAGIDGINPLKYDQKTPLVHALNELSSMVDGKNSDAVGILISDGEDTCPFTERMDVCEIARRIHQRQPKLKIHAILLGDDAYKASCIAVNTGGKVFAPKDAAQISSQIKSAASSMQKVCKE